MASSAAPAPGSFPSSPSPAADAPSFELATSAEGESPLTPRYNPTFINLPSTPSDLSVDDSGPSTPMSCISTVAIKDGHEGHRPNMTGFDGAAERISRLSRISSDLSAGGYFDVNKRPDTPTSDAGFITATSPASTAATSAGSGAGALAAALEDARRKKKAAAGAAQDSPASSATTDSAREQRREARLIDGMTYDDDVVDTTDRSPLVAGTPHEDDK